MTALTKFLFFTKRKKPQNIILVSISYKDCVQVLRFSSSMYFSHNKNGINPSNFPDSRLSTIAEDRRSSNFFLKSIIYVRKDIDLIEGHFRVILLVVATVFSTASIITSAFVCAAIRPSLSLRVCLAIVITASVCKITTK